jgi:BolA family transcriptional regulator, general stress-responsive regulator
MNAPASHWLDAGEIERRLRATLAPASLQVHDDSHRHAGHAGAREGRHYTVQLCSERFAGLPRVARHRLVYDALGPLATQGVHALAIVALAPGEAAAAPATARGNAAQHD